MKDLLVLISLIIFIVIAHSWKSPETKSLDKKNQVQPVSKLAETGSVPVKRTEVSFGISTVFNDVSETISLQEIGGGRQHYANPGRSHKLCPVHTAHEQQMSFLCPYYDYTVIPMNPQNSVRHAGFLLQY